MKISLVVWLHCHKPSSCKCISQITMHQGPSIILHVSPLSGKELRYFLPFWWVYIHANDCFLTVQKLPSLIQYHLSSFASVACDFEVLSEKSSSISMSWSTPSRVSCIHFIVRHLPLRCLIYLEFILYIVRGRDLIFMSSFPSTIYWKKQPFTNVCSWQFCQKSVDCMYMDEFLDSLFCSVDLWVHFDASTMLS